jgi:hypothetical protein
MKMTLLGPAEEQHLKKTTVLIGSAGVFQEREGLGGKLTPWSLLWPSTVR